MRVFLKERSRIHSIMMLVISVTLIISALFITQPVAAAKCGGVDTIFINCDNEDGVGGIEHILTTIFNIFSVIAMIVATIGIVWAGITWITSSGDPNRAMLAKKRMTQLIIGMAAYALLFSGAQFLLPGGFFNSRSDNGETISSNTTSPSGNSGGSGSGDASSGNSSSGGSNANNPGQSSSSTAGNTSSADQTNTDNSSNSSNDSNEDVIIYSAASILNAGFNGLTKCTGNQINVTFSNYPAADSSTCVAKNGTIPAKPSDPSYEKQTFYGYYTKEGKEFDFTSQVGSEDITLYAQWAPVIEYSQINSAASSGGRQKWIFINNPERLTEDVLADNGKLLYRDDNVPAGTSEIYYEHNISIEQDFKYAVRFFNPNDIPVDFTINRCGASDAGWDMTLVWKQYYEQQNSHCIVSGDAFVSRTMSIPPKGVLVFFSRRQTVCGDTWGFIDWCVCLSRCIRWRYKWYHRWCVEYHY